MNFRDPFFLRKHHFAPESRLGIVACDFLVAVTVRFQVLFVLLVMEVGSRRILHYNGTTHPTPDWTLQQFREALPDDRPHQFLIHDHDSIFSSELDEELQTSFGLQVLRTPVRALKANAYCERLGRNCTTRVSGFHDPNEGRALTNDSAALGWNTTINKGCPHSSLGPGMPGESAASQLPTPRTHRHKLPPDCQIRARDILRDLHNEYSRENCAT